MENNVVKTKIFVISLKGSDKRRESIKQQFGKYDIEYEIVDAVRGSELNLEHDSRVDHEAVKNAPYWLTPGAIGCSLSHLECCTRAIKEDLDYVIIFEDDAKVLENYTSYQHKIFEQIKGGEVILLYHTAFNTVYLDKKSKVQLNGQTSLYSIKEGHPISATAYILGRKAYTALAASILPVRAAADKWEYFIDSNILSEVLCVYPNPIDTMDFKSDIAYLDTGWKKRLSELIDKLQIFPFYQILREMRRRSKLKMKQTVIV